MLARAFWGSSPSSHASHACNAHEQTLKGVGGSVVILEEAAYCELQLIQEVVVLFFCAEQRAALLSARSSNQAIITVGTGCQTTRMRLSLCTDNNTDVPYARATVITALGASWDWVVCLRPNDSPNEFVQERVYDKDDGWGTRSGHRTEMKLRPHSRACAVQQNCSA